MKRPVEPQRLQTQDDISTVAALVRLLVDGGFEPGRIEASLAKSSKPATRGLLAQCCSDLPARSSRRKPPEAA